MFTTLSLVKKERRALSEKLHLTKSRRFVSREHYYSGTVFYTTRLYTFSHKNHSAIHRFTKNCGMRVITEHSPETERYLYLLTVNSFLHAFGNFPDVTLFDPDGSLIFLLTRLLSSCRTVWVCTEAAEKYEAENERLYGLLGTSAVISSQFPTHTSDTVITAVPLKIKNTYILGKCGIFADAASFIMPKAVEKETGQTDICTAAGLYSEGHIKHLSSAVCNNFKYYGKTFRCEDFSRLQKL